MNLITGYRIEPLTNHMIRESGRIMLEVFSTYELLNRTGNNILIEDTHNKIE